MVLTESDYLEFQLYFQNKSLPRRVQINLLSKFKLILGYSLEDINIRIILSAFWMRGLGSHFLAANHIKLWIFDGEVGFFGGIGIESQFRKLLSREDIHEIYIMTPYFSDDKVARALVKAAERLRDRLANEKKDQVKMRSNKMLRKQIRQIVNNEFENEKRIYM